MRERWAVLQNQALERHGAEERVDHRSLEAQREAALARGDERTAETLDRAPEVKLGPTVSAIERREERAAEREERAYAPSPSGAPRCTRRARRAASSPSWRGSGRPCTRRCARGRKPRARPTPTPARRAPRGSRPASRRSGPQPSGRGSGRSRGSRAGARPARGLAHGPAPGEERGREAGRDPSQERQASRDSIKERLGRITGREEATRHAQDGPAGRRRACQLTGWTGRTRSAASARGHPRAAGGPAGPGAAGGEREREEPAAGLPAHRQEQERTEEAQRARSAEAIREQLRGVLDRAKPVASGAGGARPWERARGPGARGAGARGGAGEDRCAGQATRAESRAVEAPVHPCPVAQNGISLLSRASPS